MPQTEMQPASSTPALTDRQAWKDLAAHAAELKSTTLKDLFAQDPSRGPKYTLEAEGLLLDYSKNRITDETLKLFVALAEAVDLKGRTEAMFTGEKINITEGRAVLHTALRAMQNLDLSTTPSSSSSATAPAQAPARLNVKIFATLRELQHYTQQTGRYFPKQCVKAQGTSRSLLRELM